MAYIKRKEKEKEGHLKTKTIRFGTKGYLSKKAKTKEITEVEPKKKTSAWIIQKKKKMEAYENPYFGKKKPSGIKTRTWDVTKNYGLGKKKKKDYTNQ